MNFIGLWQTDNKDEEKWIDHYEVAISGEKQRIEVETWILLSDREKAMFEQVLPVYKQEIIELK